MQILVYIPLVYFLVLFFIQSKKNTTINAGSAVTLFYIISSIFAVVMVEEDIVALHSFILPDFHVVPTILYCGLLTLSILPMYRYHTEKIEYVHLDEGKKQLFMVICWVLIALTFLDIILNFNDIVSTLLYMDLADVRGDAYEEMSNHKFTRFSASIFQYIISFGIASAPLLLLFFFYVIIYMPNKKFLAVMLLLSSLVLVFISFLSASRTQLIYWVMSFVFLYATFYGQMNRKVRKGVNATFLLLGIAGFIYISAVTVSRFSDRNDTDVDESVINYAGQEFIQFTDLYNRYSFREVTFDRVLPITTKYILGHDFNMTEYREQWGGRLGMRTGVFFTFLGDAMLDFGKFGMCLYTLIFYLVAMAFVKRRRAGVVSLSNMMIFIAISRIPLLGMFAYYYKGIQTSSFLIICFLMAYLLKPSRKI